MPDIEHIPQVRFEGFADAWEQRKLGEIAEIKTGPFGSTLHAEDYVAAGVPIITTEHFKSGALPKNKENIPQVSLDDYRRLSGYVLRLGDIVFSRVGSVDINATVSSCNDGWLFSGRVLRVRPSSKMNSLFLHSLLETSSVKNDIKGRAVGQTMPCINTEILRITRLIFPFKKEERSQIGLFFKALDDLITLHQRKYDKLVNLKVAMLEKMFPRDGADVPEIRFHGFTDAWEQREFSTFAQRKAEFGAEPELPRIEYEDIVADHGRLNKDVSKKDSRKIGLKFFSGDILFGKLRPYLKNWLLPDFSGLAVGDFWVLTPIKASSEFLYYLIQAPEFFSISNQSAGSKMPRSDWALVSKHEFLLPREIKEQQKIGTFFRSLDDLITLHQRKLEKLRNVKQACLEKMFVS